MLNSLRLAVEQLLWKKLIFTVCQFAAPVPKSRLWQTRASDVESEECTKKRMSATGWKTPPGLDPLQQKPKGAQRLADLWEKSLDV